MSSNYNMSSKNKPTLMERALKQQEVSRKHKILYDAKMAIPVICPYCCSNSSIWLITKHMRQSKKCLKLKELMMLTSDDPPKLEAKILLQLNKFKRGIYDDEAQVNAPLV